ncbi:trafficking protein particle complex subunit 11 [Microplitis mediator]|uniref:trafficking protein particle complex subunit 11 n=1 Tax=Microplitis mediator TaxID=375433 RepID=UPI0025562575|nr:trafficking protein particle complex subunit 11 [Microplitis mediator]
MSDLPSELVAKPLALIGLSGLDISNSMHRSIWDAFSSNRRPDGPAIQFKLLSPQHKFPTAKPKRNSYDWYIPKGILKRNWMNKYLNEVPSVVVYFHDLDWNDPMWNEKKMECASRVQSLRRSLEGRSTKIAVVLIQVVASPASGAEDVMTTERAAALCSACELAAKSLYVLPHGDHLHGYTSRLENAFHELSQNFYHHQYRIVKGHRDQLNKTSHQYLFVRHQYKMGFLNEFKQEKMIALKHYQHAYNNLLEIRMLDTNTFEIKTIASFINYKLCRLMFSSNQPRDAISQFRAHVDRFRSRTGPENIIFEHHAWMASQYSTFAELFDEAIRQGLPPVQTQHPGYYFQLAAQHAGLRQSACKQLCDIEEPPADPLLDEGKLEFYGQRPWRPGKHGAEPADVTREDAAIAALKYKEKNVNHSMIIIGLLGNAMSQFKLYRCPRMRRLLVVQMAAEYYNERDYGKVLTLLMHMLWEYRTERWPVLLTDILKNALRAAYLSTSIQDYITLAIEALGPFTTFTKEQRADIYNNIVKIISRKIPDCEFDLPSDAKKLAVDKWTSELNRPDNFMFTIDDNNISSFINVKASFSSPQYTVGGPVIVNVFVRNFYESEIEFSKIIVTIGTGGFSSEFPVKETADKNLCFAAKETKKFICEFPAGQQPEASEIKITAVSLYLGNDNNFCIVMKFSAAGSDPALLDRFYPDIQQLRNGTFETIRPITAAEIKQPESSLNISVDSSAPALVSEWLPVKLSLSCHQDIKNIKINLKQIIGDNSSDRTTELSLDMSDKQSAITIELKSLDKNNPVEQTIYVRSHQVSTRNFLVKIDYAADDDIKRSKEITYSLSVVKPFDVTTQFYTQLFEPLTKAFVNEQFIVMPHVVCTSPWPILILDTSVELGNSMARKNNERTSVLKDVTLRDGETATDIYCVIPKAGSEQPTSTGVYTIKWKRDNEDQAIETSISVTLSPVWVEDAVVGLEAKLPAQGWVQTPLCVEYFIKNYSDYLFTLRLTMESSDAFMFAGQKQVDISVRPNNEKKIEWILRPLVAGFVALPTLSLSVPIDDEHKLFNKNRLLELLGRSLPTHIYIMPKSPTAET